jgi:adenylate cyclase
MAPPDRRLVPIVSLDVVGYTRLIQHSERQTLRLVERVYEVLIKRTIGEQGGKVFKTMGDGLLAEFPSVIGAVEWATRLQKSLHERQLRTPGGGALQIRAGIVLADVLVSGDDLFGGGVNLAVRVQSHAPPGGVAITKWMHEYIDGRLDIDFVDIGPTELKNIPKTVRLFIWHPQKGAAQGAVAALEPPPPAPSNRPSVVVLPFDNLSGEADQGYFADAVVEEITATLSRIRDFFVIARNSAFTYKGRSVDVRQVGRELGVRYVVEGSVRRVGPKVRITAQLIEADTGNHIWSTKIDGAVSDLFDLQDRMAAEVAAAILPSIRRAEVERARSKRPDTLAAYDLVMRALPQLWAHRQSENREAIALLERALALEPNYTLAAALAAWAYAQQIAYHWTDDFAGERERAQKWLEVASSTLPEDPSALTALGSAIMLSGGDVAEALAFVDKALVLDPNHAWAWMRRGFGQVYLGRPDDGLSSFERATRMSPLDPFTFNIHVGMGLAHFAAGRTSQAIASVKQALAERPGITWPYRDLAAYLGHSGDLPAARSALAKFVDQRLSTSFAVVSDGLRFMGPVLHDRYMMGLRLAGLE